MKALSLTLPFNAYITKHNRKYNTEYCMTDLHQHLDHSKISSLRSFFSTPLSFPVDSIKLQLLLTINKIIVVTNNIEYLTMPKYIAR